VQVKDLILPQRGWFVGVFSDDGDALALSLCDRGNRAHELAIVIFTEELLARKWRDEHQPGQQVQSYDSADQAKEWIATAMRQCRQVKYVAIDPITSGAAVRMRALFVEIDLSA
jgi:hypothetical protein